MFAKTIWQASPHLSGKCSGNSWCTSHQKWVWKRTATIVWRHNPTPSCPKSHALWSSCPFHHFSARAEVGYKYNVWLAKTQPRVLASSPLFCSAGFHLIESTNLWIIDSWFQQENSPQPWQQEKATGILSCHNICHHSQYSLHSIWNSQTSIIHLPQISIVASRADGVPPQG